MSLLTPSQSAAVVAPGHVSVTANAGSGKTRVLIERYVRLVLGGLADVSEIVALTYTEKAAGELKRKIAEQLAREREAAPPERRPVIDAVRARLPSGFVGTIHAFCARLLRDHPVEADIDASFRVLEGLDRKILEEESLREAFSDIMGEADESGLRGGVADAARALGTSRFLRLVRSVLDRRELAFRWKSGGGPYARGDDELLALWDAAIDEFAARELLAASFQDDLRLVRAAGTGRLADATADAFRALASPGLPARERAGLLTVLLGEVLTQDGKLRVTYTGKRGGDAAAVGAARRLQRWNKHLRPVLAHVETREGSADHRALLRTSRVVLEAARRVLERYDRRKAEASQLDFEDLQLKARDLLAHDAVRRRLQLTYRYILVDEYQDTNELQYDVLRPLVDDLRAGSLFIVGDPKQSIYSFRGADVEVFLRTKEEIVRAAGGEAGVVLEESFRPLLTIVAFANRVFQPLMGPGGEGGGIAYERLVRARDNEAPGRVELLIRADDESSRLTEADLIARRILQLHAEGYTVFSRDETPRNVRFRDIALLLRGRTGLVGIEEAFVAHGVPYIVSGGVGYFQTQDVLDVYNYFSFLLNPADDAALVGVLRSPFFGVSDAELFEAVLERGRRSIWTCLEESGTTAPTLAAATRRLAGDLAVARTLTVPELLARLLRSSALPAALAGLPRGAQGLANIEKLQRMAHAFDAAGMATLYDFTRRLKRLIEEEEREGQGSVDSQGDAVHIMTVHAAKGLEFPIVVLPELHRAFQQEREPYWDADLGMAFNPRVSDDEEREDVPLAMLLAERARRKSLAEEKRILYVGVTRARDLLILSGESPRNRDAETSMNWILNTLGVPIDPTDGALSYPEITEVLRRTSNGFVRNPVRHELVVRLLRERDLLAIPPPPAVEKPTPLGPILLPDPPEAGTRGEVYSATRIRTYLECPARYYLRYRLGFPDVGARVPPPAEDELEEAGSDAELVGTLFHAVMREIDSVDAAGPALEERCTALLARERSPATVDIDRITARTASLVRAVLSSPVWRDITSGIEPRTEFTISAPLGSDYVVGTMDRVFRNRNGEWTIVDYKTDSIPADAIDVRAALYLPQLRLYALLVSMLFDAPSVKLIVLFAHHVESPVTVVMTREDIAAFRTTVTEVVGSIRAGRFAGRSTPCDGCPFPPGICAGF